MTIIRNDMTFRSETQANQYFSKNPIKAAPVLLFKSKQAANKWIQGNKDLLPFGSGSVDVVKTIDGYKIYLAKDGYWSFLSQDETGKYYWSEMEPVELGKPIKDCMDANFALFNSHKNKADIRVKKAFIEFFGQEEWDKEIQPLISEGVMSMLSKDQNEYTKFYVWSIWLLVNKF